MPFQGRPGDNSKARYCGLETDFNNDIPEVLKFNHVDGGFDFIVTPLKHPGYRPSSAEEDKFGFSGSDFAVSAKQWNERVIGKISSWIDLDSEDKNLRMDSETTLKEEIAWASYLSLQACLLPAPKGTSCVNYARCVHQILHKRKNMKLWLRIPLGKADDKSSATSGTSDDSWATWNSFRQICEHHSQLSIAFDNLSTLPSDKSLERWFGESVSAAILHTDIFLTKTQGSSIKKYLSKRHQRIISSFFDHSMQIIIYGGKQADPKTTLLDSSHRLSPTVSYKHPLRPYLDCVGHLYEGAPLSKRETLEFPLRDNLRSLLPINNDLDAQDYMDIENDPAKYNQYQSAICQALLERVPDEKASEITTVLMVVGAGRGALVKASVQAAEDAERKLKVYAVEKNANALVALNEKIREMESVNFVTIVSSDVRYWNAPETVDIMVSELLGSFSDNDLSPEILDAAQRFLKEDGISIPTSYTSFLQPLTASKLYSHVKKHKDSQYETAFVAKIHNVARLAPPQPAFTFSHPKNVDKESNQRYKKLHFAMHKDIGSAMVHGFAGYFDAILYKDVHLGIEPSRATPDLRSWFPMFFPLRTPVCVDGGSTLEVNFWRCCNTSKVWYEWCVTAPTLSPIYNSNGRSYWMGL